MELPKMYKKGNLGNMQAFAIGFVIVVIVIALGAKILSSFQSTQTAGTYEYNVTGKGLSGLVTWGDYLPIIAIILIIVVVLAILLGGLAGKKR